MLPVPGAVDEAFYTIVGRETLILSQMIVVGKLK
jgi:hypothetical protein